MNWALKDDRSWNEEVKGKGIPGTRNSISKGPVGCIVVGPHRRSEELGVITQPG